MNTLALIAAMNGTDDPELARMIDKMEATRKRKLKAVIESVGENLATGYRFFKGQVKIIDATGAEMKPEDPRYSGLLLKYKDEQDIKFAALENAFKGSVRIALEFLLDEDSMEGELLARMAKGKRPAEPARPTAAQSRFGA
jgi:hypothetical protein